MIQKQKGKYLFLDLEGFGNWLETLQVNREIRSIQNHHTLIPSYKDFTGENYFALQRGMEEMHLERGFDTIAQQFTIFPDGIIATGRSMELDPAGIRGANKGAICIENLGNFDLGQDEMTETERQTIVGANALLCRKFKLTPSLETLVYHHWYDLETGKRTGGTGTVKSCPGTAFFGGNSLTDAERSFIPLVQKELLRLEG